MNVFDLGARAVTASALVASCLLDACGGGPEPAPEPEPAPAHPDAVASSAAPAAPERLSKTELARKVFEAVQAHDFERFSGFIPDADDLADMLPDLPAEEAEQLLVQMHGTQRGMFEEAYARGEAQGIVWEAATFVGAEQNGSDNRPNIFIIFEHAGEPYSMKMDDCLETRRGWIVGDYLDAPHHGESHREPVD